ncbi:hypothetical protein F2Q69_00030830 [Brassica cretica]|uniref:Uncharacterized protein n=1 Tax=Brassica cretica TaxID=69181 RepID=A0A8S9RUL6_BRACR|nr:hypothetical protein F2Q69_00030830 [Brassica cretica]
MDGRILNISKEDIAEIISMNGSMNFLDIQNIAEDSPSIDEPVGPSINGQPKFRQRALHQKRKRKPCWESRNEYGVIPTVPKQDTYSKAETHEVVAEIYRAIRASDDYHSKRLDGIYYPFNNSICWLTTHTNEMKQDIAMIKEQHAVGAGTSKSIAAHTQPLIAAHTQPSIDTRIQSSIDARLASFEDRLQSFTYRLDGVYYPLDFQAEQSPSIDRRTRPSINSDHTPLGGKLVIEKFLQDKFDEITFSQDLLKEYIYHELKDIAKSTHARIGMQQLSIGNIHPRMNAIEVDIDRQHCWEKYQDTGLRVPARRLTGSPLGSTPGPTFAIIPSSGRNGNLPIRGSFHISEYGRFQPYWTTEADLKTTI